MNTDKIKEEMKRVVQDADNTMMEMLINHRGMDEKTFRARLDTLSAAFEQAGFWQYVDDTRRSTFRNGLENLLKFSKDEDHRDPRIIFAVNEVLDRNRDRLGSTIRLAIID